MNPTLVLLAALGAPAQLTVPPECSRTDAHLSASAAAQGGVALLEVAAGAVEPIATWGAKPLRFWRDDADGRWRAFIGVDLERRPGDASVTLRTAHEGTCTVPLFVEPVAFPEERLELPPRFVDLSPRDRARAAREAARLAARFRAVTRERLWHGAFQVPLEGVQPSSSFGRRRILNGQPRSPHTGVDLGAPTGTAVHAMQRGRVILDEDLFFSGRTVILDHGLGLFSLYGHLSESRVVSGRVVDAGEVIGLVGATGRVTAPHLHWAVRIGDARVDGLDLVRLTSASAPAASANPPLVADASSVCDSCAEWNADRQPFRVFGNTYYVGVAGLSSVLITSNDGHVLIDGALPQSAPLIDAHIRALGFRTEDVKLILNSHAHFDHAGGIRALQRASGATVAASPRGAEALARGGPVPDDPQAGLGAVMAFPPVKDVSVVKDGQTLRVGPLAVTAHLTPGHTPGSTTWTWRSCEGARCLDVVYADSITPVAAPGFRYTGDASHPSIVAGFRRSIAAIAGLPCDILLSTHPGFSGIDEKRARRQKGETDAFVDGKACRAYAETGAKALDARIAAEK